MNPYTGLLIMLSWILLCVLIAIIEEAIRYFRPKKENANVKFKPAIMKTVYPDKQLSFNQWMKHIKRESDKYKKRG